MKRLNRYIAFCAGVLLLAAPAAWACGQIGEMSAECDMPEMAGSMGGTAMCHDGGQMADDCCDVGPAPDTAQAISFQSLKLLTTLVAVDLQEVAPPAPAALSPDLLSADGFRLHDLGRYTLFSSFLL
ncbi:MAG: hypothetical protein HKN37_13750 [Rhodothermales bacterium]|nr:hypothetical protein [Rhodothermales bacterium]